MYAPANPIDTNHVKHRETARAFLTNQLGELLLIKTHWDPGTGLPPRWLTPGGGIDAGESILEAAARELWEETGLEVTQEQLGEPAARLEFKIDWAGGKYETGVAHFFSIQSPEGFEVNNSNWTEDEHRDVIELRWWQIDELLNSSERFGPPGLVDLIRSHFCTS